MNYAAITVVYPEVSPHPGSVSENRLTIRELTGIFAADLVSRNCSDNAFLTNGRDL